MLAASFFFRFPSVSLARLICSLARLGFLLISSGIMFEQAWTEYGQRVSNAFMIDMGLFRTDPDISIVGNTFSILSCFTWEAP